nr:uncharacterized protein LOC112030039 [Quercus suber]POF02866.1 uncharacterized protein CFP56_10923 [Quercus suber]
MALSLSKEEQEELSRSKEKVKDDRYGQKSDPPSPNRGAGPWSQSMSFKDKLVGEIPGAYIQAFNFGEAMEDGAESDEEVENLRRGLVAVKFSSDFKQQIRDPWVRALIVKVYGKSVGFNFLQSKLLALWRPASRLDCVNLGNGFVLTRLSLKEDFENVLKKGPWFIGGHFLSLRLWEPDFRPSSANISSVAVWVRLNELPIEYYNAEALKHIGNAIGNMLRVDTFIASESRGRFARLCIQIDVEKPLVTAILIGKHEQSVAYKGIQNLCFECGRLGHRREACPYLVRQHSPIRETEVEVESKGNDQSCSMHEQEQTSAEVGPDIVVQEIVQKDRTQDVRGGTYVPWVVVARRKNETRARRNGGTPVGQINAQGIRGNGRNEWVSKESVGPSRETKRKLSPSRTMDRAQFASVIQNISKESNYAFIFMMNLIKIDQG